MKTLQISNSNNTKVVRYLTDLIGSNESFMIFQIKQSVSGVEQTPNVLTDAVIQDGFFHKLQQHQIEEFIEFVQNKGYTLKSYETTALGVNVETTIWASGYGNGGAIGEDRL